MDLAVVSHVQLGLTRTTYNCNLAKNVVGHEMNDWHS